MWYAGPIDILSHSYIISHNWKALQNVIINCTKDSIYWLTSDVLECTCTIILFYVAGGVSSLLVLHVWYGGMQAVHHDLLIFILQEVPHTMVKQTWLVHLKWWPLLAADDKTISILAVVGQKVIFLDKTEEEDVSYSVGIIPFRIIISGEVTNLVGVCHCCVTADMYIFTIRMISDIWEIFPID